MATLIDPRYRKQISMTSAEKMMEGSEGGGILDLVNFAFEWNQAASAEKNAERKRGVAEMVKAAQVDVNWSADDIQNVLNLLNDYVEKDPAYTNPAKAISLKVNSVLERRKGIDDVSDNMQEARNSLRELEKKATETGEYLPSEAEKILIGLGDAYLKNERYLDSQQGLKENYARLLGEASDMFDMLTLMDQTDAIKYIKTEVQGLPVIEGAGLQLPEGTEDLPVEWKGDRTSRRALAQYAESNFQARNYAGAKEALLQLQMDWASKGMKLADQVRSAGPLIEKAVATIRKANQTDDLPERLQALPDMRDFFNSMSLTNLTSPEQIEEVFGILSQYIFEAADLEELTGPPHSVQGLDEYLATDRANLIRDLDDYQSVIVSNLLQAREILAKGYKETYGKDLIISKDADLEDMLGDIVID